MNSPGTRIPYVVGHPIPDGWEFDPTTVTAEGRPMFIRPRQSSAASEVSKVWDPIMCRYVAPEDVYVPSWGLPAPYGPKSVTPWESKDMAQPYKHYTGIPAVQDPPAKETPKDQTESVVLTTLAGIVLVEWHCANADAGSDLYIDWKKGTHQFCVLHENKVIHLANPYSGLFCVSVWQDGSGPWTLDWAINGSGLPVVYWPGGVEPIMTATVNAHDMYSFAWLPYANAGAGAYEGMATQDMRVP